MLGSRFLGDPLAGGMPRWKYVSNRFLTGLENAAFGLHLSEYHTGLRAYSRHLLETIPYRLNSDDFVFDQELIAQVVAAGGLAVGEIAVPTRYFEEASSVGFRRSVVYGLSTLRVVVRYLLHRTGLRRSAKLRARGRYPATRRRLTCAVRRWPLRAGGAGGRHLDRRAVPRLPVRWTSRPPGRAPDRRPPLDGALVALHRRDVLLRAVRWQVLLAPWPRCRSGTTLGSLLVGYLANNVLPARLGEVIRSHDLGDRTGISRTTILGTIVVERVVDTVVVVSIAAVAILVMPVRGVVASAVLVGAALTALLVMVIALGIVAHRLPGAERVTASSRAGHGSTWRSSGCAAGLAIAGNAPDDGGWPSCSRSRRGRAPCSRSRRPPRRSASSRRSARPPCWRPGRTSPRRSRRRRATWARSSWRR